MQQKNSDNPVENLDPARQISRIMVDLARERGHLEGPLAVTPDLVETEKTILSLIAATTRQRTEIRKQEELDEEEIASLFVFVYAKAIEAVFCWRNRDNIPAIEPEGMFTGQVSCKVNPDVFEHFNNLTLPADACESFYRWIDESPPDPVHPILPLLEFLKWTYRLAIGMALDFTEPEK